MINIFNNSMIETWKEVSGYENLYEISNLGNVRNARSGRILRPVDRRDGYLQVTLCKNGEKKNYQIHRLVAQAFLFNPLQKPQINHRNEIKTNNRLENLEWCTAEYNINYGTHNERMAKSLLGKNINSPALSRKVICVESGKIYPSTMEASRQTRINQSNISACCLGKKNHSVAGGYHWRYVD